MRHVITSSWRVLAVAGVFAIGSAVAQEHAATAVKPTNTGPSAQAPSRQVALPTCLEKLNLTPQQQAQIQEIACDYEVDVASVWKQFSARYLETIRTEAILLSAIEDNLTEPQRQQVRDQRRRVARHEKTLAGTRAPAPPTTPDLNSKPSPRACARPGAARSPTPALATSTATSSTATAGRSASSSPQAHRSASSPTCLSRPARSRHSSEGTRSSS